MTIRRFLPAVAAVAALSAHAMTKYYTEYITTNDYATALHVGDKSTEMAGLEYAREAVPGQAGRYNYAITFQAGGNAVKRYAFYRPVYNASTVADAMPAEYSRILADDDSTARRYVYSLANAGGGQPYSVTAGTGYTSGRIEELAVEGGWDTTPETTAGVVVMWQGCHIDYLCTISFAPGEGTGSMSSQQIENAGVLKPNEFTKTGYSFMNWSAQGGGTYADGAEVGSASSPLKKDLALTAQWTQNVYTVTFDAAGGSVATASKPVAFDSAYGQLPTPALAGHDFGGWYLVQSPGELDQPVTPDTIAKTASDHALYAHWTAKSYQISLTNNGATSGPTAATLVYGTDDQDSLNIPSYGDNFAFGGYWTEPDGGGMRYFDGDGNWCGGVWTNTSVTRLYAKKVGVEYWIVYNANGGNGTVPAQQTCDTAVDAVLAFGDGLARHGFSLAGWSQSAGATEATFEVGEAVQYSRFAGVGSGATINLYAVWIDNTFPVTFDAQGGTVGGVEVAVVSNQYVSGTAYGTLPVPVSAAGLAFAGWWTSTDVTNRVQHTASAVADENVKRLYARWKASSSPQTCTISLDADGGSLGDAASEFTRPRGAALGELPVPVRDEEHRFAWWYDDSTKHRVTAETVVEGNMTIKARWSLTKYDAVAGDNDIAFVSDTNESNGEWSAETDPQLVDGAAATLRSGSVLPLPSYSYGHYSYSAVGAYLPSPGTVSFRWSVVCDAEAAALWFFTNSTMFAAEDHSHTAETQTQVWAEVSIAVDSEIKWTYAKQDSEAVSLPDCAWISSVSWTPDVSENPIGSWSCIADVTNAYGSASFSSAGADAWAACDPETNAVRASGLSDGHFSSVRLSVEGQGELRFEWSVDCEQGYVDEGGEYVECDALEFLVDGVRVAAIEGCGAGFSEFVYTNAAAGAHTYEWRYAKDASTAAGADAASLRNVEWKGIGLFEITLDAAGGTCDTASVLREAGAQVGSLPEPTYYGHSFAGWWTEPAGGTEVTDATVVTADATYYAHWTNRLFTVAFDAMDGTCETSSVQRQEGAAIGALPEATLAGHSPAGWWTEPAGGTEVTAATVVTADATCYAHWTANAYTVSFDPAGGTCGTAETNVTYGSAYGWLPAPSLDGHSFAGWWTEPAGGTEVTAATVVETASDHVLYAHWSDAAPAVYTVSFDPAGGTCGTAETNVTYGSAYGWLPAPSLDGHSFAGWWTEPAGGTEVTAATVVETAADHVLYAHWTENAPPAPDQDPGYDVIDEDDVDEPYMAEKSVSLPGAVYDGSNVVGVVELKLGKVNQKKHTSKISGSVTGLDGKKRSIAAKTVYDVYGTDPATVSLEVKGLGTMTVTVGGTRFAGSLEGGLHVQSAAAGGAWEGNAAAVAVDIDDTSTFPGMVVEGLLPFSETAGVKGGKWSFDKATGVKWTTVKPGMDVLVQDETGKGLVVDASGGKTNKSGMKLSYAPKKGTFKGSFKVYALQSDGAKTKLVKYTVNVSGVVVDNVGWGMATCKKLPAVEWAVSVK